jgi:hypothetical protein
MQNLKNGVYIGSLTGVIILGFFLIDPEFVKIMAEFICKLIGIN